MCCISVPICNHLDGARTRSQFFVISKQGMVCNCATSSCGRQLLSCGYHHVNLVLSIAISVPLHLHLTCYSFWLRFLPPYSTPYLVCPFILLMDSYIRGCGGPGFASILFGPYYLSNTQSHVCLKCIRNSVHLPGSAVSCLEFFA